MGMSQEAFADRCGFARTYMSRIETGGANPSINAIKVLADALGVSISDLFEGMWAGPKPQRQPLKAIEWQLQTYMT